MLLTELFCFFNALLAKSALIVLALKFAGNCKILHHYDNTQDRLISLSNSFQL